METVREFMQKYFIGQAELDRESIARGTPFRERCFTGEFLAAVSVSSKEDFAYELDHPAMVEEIELVGDSAIVKASWPCVGSTYRGIFYLKATSVGWQIDRKGRECYNCKGAGIEGGASCNDCDEVGWKFYGASAR